MIEYIDYIVFAIIVIIMLALDLGVFNKHSHKVSNKEAVIWSCIWITLSLTFGVFVYLTLGTQPATEYLTAYLIEKALSVDNLFVFILIFSFFKVPDEHHHRVLFWGVLGALIMRAIFIFSGTAIINFTYLPEMVIFGKSVHLNIVLTLFGFFLIYAGIKSAMGDDEEDSDFSESLGVKIVRKFFPVTEEYDGGKFFTLVNGRRFATPLLLVIGVIEVTDLLFAVDSIPAIFAVSRDPFILYSSNIFAVLGLRSLYFLLANFMHLFCYLPYGLSVILSFIGVKMVIADFYKISSPVSLSIVGLVLILSVILSILFPKKEEKAK